MHLIALLAYLLLSIAVTWPIALHFTTHVVGELYSDRTQNIWNIWWLKTALLDRHTNPFHTDLLLYPQGTDLYFYTLALPSTLLTLLPLLIFGLAAAYNSSVILALVLSGYAGFRLASYLTGNVVAGLVGGIIIGFNSLTIAMTHGEINIVSVQWMVLCIEFFLRTWAGGQRRYAILTGLFFSLALLTLGYFEVQLLVFFMVYLVWAFLTIEGKGLRVRIAALFRKMRPVLLWGGGTALILVGPYLLAAWSSLRSGQIMVWGRNDDVRVLSSSADLLSFFLPSHNHWLLGSAAPWWASINSGLDDYTYLGVATLILAFMGAYWNRKRPDTWLWCAVAAVGALLALGPVLQINKVSTFGTTTIPMPFALLRLLPGVSLVRAPERFAELTFISLGVLAGFGLTGFIATLSAGSAKRRPWRLMAPAALIALLFFEMPFHYRQIDPLDVPPSFTSLGAEAGKGALLELPLTQHTRVDVYRMLYETAHGHPITSAYLSRDVVDPYEQACSRLNTIRKYPSIGDDIVSPSVSVDNFSSLLATDGFGFVAVYKKALQETSELTPISDSYLSALQDLAARLGTSIADDGIVTVYRLRPSSEPLPLVMQLGPNWYALETSQGRPFRWLNGSEADLCVFSPAANSASLTFAVTSFNNPHHLQVLIGDRKLFESDIPSDTTFHTIMTPPVAWPAGSQRVRFVTSGGRTSPADVGQGNDERQLSLGFSSVHLESPNH